MTADGQDQAKKLPRWWPWAAVGFLLLVLCLGWFLLPLREWIEALQSWLLGLGLWGVLIFISILIVVTFLPAPDWPLPIAAGYVYGFWAFPLTYASIAFARAGETARTDSEGLALASATFRAAGPRLRRNRNSCSVAPCVLRLKSRLITPR
jgi:hypothetical protein